MSLTTSKKDSNTSADIVDGPPPIEGKIPDEKQKKPQKKPQNLPPPPSPKIHGEESHRLFRYDEKRRHHLDPHLIDQLKNHLDKIQKDKEKKESILDPLFQGLENLLKDIWKHFPLRFFFSPLNPPEKKGALKEHLQKEYLRFKTLPLEMKERRFEILKRMNPKLKEKILEQLKKYPEKLEMEKINPRNQLFELLERPNPELTNEMSRELFKRYAD
jgi:hypothetical protein